MSGAGFPCLILGLSERLGDAIADGTSCDDIRSKYTVDPISEESNNFVWMYYL